MLEGGGGKGGGCIYRGGGKKGELGAEWEGLGKDIGEERSEEYGGGVVRRMGSNREVGPVIGGVLE